MCGVEATLQCQPVLISYRLYGKKQKDVNSTDCLLTSNRVIFTLIYYVSIRPGIIC